MSRKCHLEDDILDFVFKKGKAREKDLREAFVNSGKCSWPTLVKYKKQLEKVSKLKKKEEKFGFDLIVMNPPWDAVKPEMDDFFSVYYPKFRRLRNKVEKEKVMK